MKRELKAPGYKTVREDEDLATNNKGGKHEHDDAEHIMGTRDFLLAAAAPATTAPDFADDLPTLSRRGPESTDGLPVVWA